VVDNDDLRLTRPGDSTTCPSHLTAPHRRTVLVAMFPTDMNLNAKKDLAIEISIYVVSVTLVSLLWQRPVTLCLCCLFMSSFMLYRWHSRSDLIFYSVAFVFGSAADMIAVTFGAWRYSEALYLVPIWLPLLWGIAALLLKRISESVLRPS
jgi:hypothetical protein